MADLGKAYVQIIPSAQGISGQIEKVLSPEANNAGKNAGSTIGQQIGSFAKKAVIGLGVGKAISDSVSNGMEFETAMAKASTLFSGTDTELNKLQSDILDISNKTGVAAAQLAEAAYSAESASVPMGNLGTMIESSAKLATAGYTDIDTALSATAKTMNAYGMVSDDVTATNEAMEKVQRILIQTQNKGITTVGELGASLANVTPTAAAAGVGFEQVGAALAVMTAQGTPTAQATTQLRSAIAELEKEGTKASGALEKAAEGTEYAGMSFVEMMDSGADLGDVMGMLQDYADKSGVSMLDLWSSVEGGNAAMAIAKDVGNFDDSLAAMATDADVVGEAYGTMADTMENQMARIGTSLTNLGIEAFTAAAPFLTSALNGVLQVFQRIKPVLSTLGGAFGKLLSAVGGIIGKLLGLDEGLSVTDSISQGLTIVINGISGAIGFLADAVSVAGEFIVPIFKGIGDIAQTVWDAVSGLFTGTIEIPSLDGVASAAWSGLSGIAGGVWDFVKGIFGGVVDFISLDELATTAWSTLEGTASGVWALVKGVFGALDITFADVSEYASTAWGAITTAAGTIWQGVKDLFGGDDISFADVGAFAETVWGSITTAAGTIWEGVKTLYGGIDITFADLSELASIAWGTLEATASGVWDLVKGVFGGIVDFSSLDELANAAWGTLEDAAGAVWGLVADVFGGVDISFSDLFSLAEEAWGTLTTAAESIWGTIQGVFSGVDISFSDLSEIATAVWNTLEGAASGIWDLVKGVFSSVDISFSDLSEIATAVWNTLEGAASGVWDLVKGVFSATDITFEDVSAAASTAWDTLTTTANSIWDGIKGIFGSFEIEWPDFGELASGALEGLKSAAKGVWDWVKGLFSGDEEDEAVKTVQGSTAEMASSLAEAKLQINEVDLSSIITANEFVKNSIATWKTLFETLQLKLPAVEVVTLLSAGKHVQTYAKRYKDLMNFSWTLPTLHGHLPVISVNMRSASSSDGKTRVSYPDLSVSGFKWFAQGGIFKKPTIIGIGDSKGPEAAVPLNTMWDRMAEEFDKHLNGGVTMTNYITIDGTQNPEEFADRLVRQLKLDLRTA